MENCKLYEYEYEYETAEIVNECKQVIDQIVTVHSIEKGGEG